MKLRFVVSAAKTRPLTTSSSRALDNLLRLNSQLLPLTVAAATAVFGESIIHRSSSRRLSDAWRGRNFDFGDFASSDSSYEAFQQPSFQPSIDSPSLNHVTPHHDQSGRDSKSHSKGSSGGTVNEFDNLTPYHSGEVSGGAASNESLDPEARFFIDMCAVKNFFGRKKRSAAPIFFFHYGYNRCSKGYYGKGHDGKGYGHGHRKRRK